MKLLLLPFALLWLLFDWLRGKDRKMPPQRYLLNYEPIVYAIGDTRLEAWVKLPKGEAIDLYREGAWKMPEDGDAVLVPVTMLPAEHLERLRPASLHPLPLETALCHGDGRILLRARGSREGVVRRLLACLDPGPAFDREDGQPVAARYADDDVFLHVAADSERKGAALIGVMPAQRLREDIPRLVRGLQLALDGKQPTDGDDARLPDKPRRLPGQGLPLPCGDRLTVSAAPARIRLDVVGADGRQASDPVTPSPLAVRMAMGRYYLETTAHGDVAAIRRQLLAFVDGDGEQAHVVQERGYFAGGTFHAGGACLSVDDLSYGDALEIEFTPRPQLHAELLRRLDLLEQRLPGA